MSDCNNGAGYCDFYSSYLRCYISNNETQFVKSLLSYCSGQSTAFVSIYVYKNYVSTAYGNLIIDIELASNIQYLRIYNYEDQDNIRLTTSSQNTGLTRIGVSSSYHIQLESGNFFNYFTSLKSISMGYCITIETPSFTNLQYLTYLYVRIGSSTRTFDNTIVRGLSNLIYLRFPNSGISSITKGAFDGLNSLTYLSFEDNKLSIIEDGTFSELSSLERLYLQNNGIKIISNIVFEGLTELTELRLDENPGFPIEALIHTRSLRSLEYVNLQYNDYHTLDPYVFQQLKLLSRIYLNNPFICDCRLQWTSIVSQYGINIYNGLCSEPNNFLLKYITNPQLYTNCSQTESYQCFDKSITCPSNQVCHNTQDGYLCSCPRGYSLHNSGECRDFDECDEETECEHTCVNTEGSYHCGCEEGYKLATNGYDCEDVNECQELNGGCQFGCRNSIGSYQCFCEYGHKLYNETQCAESIECELMGDDCINPIESGYICKGGFNLSIFNLSCPNVNSQENIPQNNTIHQSCESATTFRPVQTPTQTKWEFLPLAVVGISFVFNIFTTIVIITLLIIIIYIVRKSKNKTSNPSDKDTKTQMKLKYFNNESIYNSIDEQPQADNSRNTAAFEASPMLGKYQNLAVPQSYPAKLQDETADYQTL
ncbi:Fibrillin-3-like [Oopsacas minuta]|uniref:Fibrillin-3-like n=1 Tax=Oopsacas minuta TaxID=111878 RepID=A0AAV7JGE5_9METZ|nr:Fibrillin-3-like [Oopsacas minuta]